MDADEIKHGPTTQKTTFSPSKVDVAIQESGLDGVPIIPDDCEITPKIAKIYADYDRWSAKRVYADHFESCIQCKAEILRLQAFSGDGPDPFAVKKVGILERMAMYIDQNI